MSSKIPESEWGAIAARRESGEPVASIARTYGCSAALIYSILNRQKGIATPDDAPIEADAAPSDPPAAVATAPVAAPVPAPAPAAAPEAPVAAVPPAEPLARPRNSGTVSLRWPREPERAPPTETANGAASDAGAAPPPPRPASAAALTARLDEELLRDAEAVMTAFRSAFAETLKPSATVEEGRNALRKAASDLMRVAARTTIVLERLSAVTDTRPHPGSARSGDRTEHRPAGPARPKPDANNEFSPSGAPVDPLAPLLATVKWFSPEKRFGFVMLDDGGDVFVHAQALERSGLVRLEEGQRVRLTTRSGLKGLQADKVELLSPG